MNEIELLYRNAGIEKRRNCEFYEDCPLGFAHSCNNCDVELRDDNCLYPPFTAKKQLELIEWLSKRRLLNIVFCNDKNTYQLFNNKCTGSFCSDLATAIATLVQCELDFCTKEEKEEIRGILNERN